MAIVLVTGGAGFIGQSLCSQLLKDGHKLVVVDTLAQQIHGPNPKLPSIFKTPALKFIHTDISNIEEYENSLEEIEYVFHLASETGTGQSMYEISRYCSANVGGTASLISALKASAPKLKKIILASSRSVYGEGVYNDGEGKINWKVSRLEADKNSEKWGVYSQEGKELTAKASLETDPISPLSIYASTKLMQEYLVKQSFEQSAVSATIFRFQNVYGPGQSLQNPYTGIVSIFFNKARQGLPIELYEGGLPERDFVFIGDAVDALCAAIDVDIKHGEIFNIGFGVPISIKRIAELAIKNCASKSEIIISNKYRPGDIFKNWANIEKASNNLGFKPKVDIDDGFVRFARWALQQPVFEDLTQIAEEEIGIEA